MKGQEQIVPAETSSSRRDGGGSFGTCGCSRQIGTFISQREAPDTVRLGRVLPCRLKRGRSIESCGTWKPRERDGLNGVGGVAKVYAKYSVGPNCRKALEW